LLKPTFLAAKEQFNLTVAVSLALSDYLSEKLDAELLIKWPNDLMAAGKKISGILIENSLSGDFLIQSVVGIGVNVNQTDFEINTATSMIQLAGNKFELTDELNELLRYVEKRYLQLREGKTDLLRAEYLQRLFWKGENRIFRSNEQEFAGKIEGVDSIGKLAIGTEKGVTYFGLKEISFIR
jgi:BirA family transcriptional regulator, biotin operon repressor / biotin---[acetyl-CoA-carboxylase] ligase